MRPRFPILLTLAVLAAVGAACGSQSAEAGGGNAPALRIGIPERPTPRPASSVTEMIAAGHDADLRRYLRALSSTRAAMVDSRHTSRTLSEATDGATVARAFTRLARNDRAALRIALRVRPPHVLARAHNRLVRGLGAMARSEARFAHDVETGNRQDVERHVLPMVTRAAQDVETWYRMLSTYAFLMDVRLPPWVHTMMHSH